MAALVPWDFPRRVRSTRPRTPSDGGARQGSPAGAQITLGLHTNYRYRLGTVAASKSEESFCDEAIRLLRDTVVFGVALTQRRRVVLFKQKSLLSEFTLGKGYRIVTIPLAIIIVYGLALVALARQPWLQIRYRVKFGIAPSLYFGIGLLLLMPIAATLLPLGLPLPAILLLAFVGNPILARVHCRPLDIVGPDVRILRRLLGNRTAIRNVPRDVRSYVLLLIAATGLAWASGRHRALVYCLSELGTMLDLGNDFELAERCLEIAEGLRQSRKIGDLFDLVGLTLRMASVQVGKGNIDVAKATIHSLPQYDIATDRGAQWKALESVTYARIFQATMQLDAAISQLDAARTLAMARIPAFPGLGRRSRARLFGFIAAHAIEQRVFTCHALGRFDEAYDQALRDLELLDKHVPADELLSLRALVVYVRTLISSGQERELAKSQWQAAWSTLLQERQRAESVYSNEPHDASGANRATEPKLRLVGRPGKVPAAEGQDEPLFANLADLRRLLVRQTTLYHIKSTALTLAMAATALADVDAATKAIDMLHWAIQIEPDDAFPMLLPVLRSISHHSVRDANEALRVLDPHIAGSMDSNLFARLARAILKTVANLRSRVVRDRFLPLLEALGAVETLRVQYALQEVHLARSLYSNSSDEASDKATQELLEFVTIFAPLGFLCNLGLALHASDAEAGDDASKYFRRAVDWLEERRVLIETLSTVAYFKTRYGWVYEYAVRHFFNCRRYTDALLMADRLKCLGFLVLNQYRDLGVDDTCDKTLVQHYHYIHKQIEELRSIDLEYQETDFWDVFAKLIEGNLGFSTMDEVRAELTRLQNELDLARARIRRDHPAFRERRSVLANTQWEVPDVAKEQAIVYYHIDYDRILAFTVRAGQRIKGHAASASNRGNATTPFDKQLASWVQQYVAALQSDNNDRKCLLLSSLPLVQLLIDCIRDDLAGVTELTIVPDGPLFELPMHALVQPCHEAYLIEQWAFSYVPNLGVLRLAANESERPRGNLSSALVVVNPDTCGEWGNLDNAAAEADTVCTALKNAVRLEGAEAAKMRFINDSPSFSVIHVIAHSYADPECPLRSYIRFAGESVSDCRLHVEEVAGLHLHCTLCNLSSCQSGRISVTATWEIDGLGCSFLLAGARSIVASHWGVNDQFGKELMSTFYQADFRDHPARALQAAQRQWASDDSEFSHPKYWAPFYAVDLHRVERAPTKRAHLSLVTSAKVLN